MGGLTGFLAQNAKKIENEKIAVSKRFVDENDKPLLWEIKAITSTRDEKLRAECTKRIKTKQGMKPELDFSQYLGKVAVECTVYPNLNDSTLQDSYGVMGADKLLKTMLTPGEYSDYLVKIQSLNGFDVSFEEEVEEAKN